jgi:RNA polymerase sigma factor (TIGR02999 family)
MSEPADSPARPELASPNSGPGFDAVYAQLRALARHMLQDQRPGHTLQATALVHEAYLRLQQSTGSGISDPNRFHRIAAQAMRNILIDHARSRGRQKREGRQGQLSLDAVELASLGETDEILAVDEAIERLRAEHPELAELVELRFFAGLSNEEAARALGQSERTVYRDWAYAKALLMRALRE